MIYLDHNATTPVAESVAERMLPLMSELFGNPASPHGPGRLAAAQVDAARERVASHFGSSPSRVVFTSGATEALNLALRGPQRGQRSRLLVGATEHKAVLDTVADLALPCDVVPVSRSGALDLVAMDELLADDVSMVAVMAVNNETGVLHPIEEVVEAAHAAGALVLCDATQAVGRLDLGAVSSADMVAFSGHKIYGPKGIGALVFSRDARDKLRPIITGGGQERGLRSGTVNTVGVVGLSAALDLVEREREAEMPRQEALRDDFEHRLQLALDGVIIHGRDSRRVANTSNVRFAGVDGQALIANLDTVAAATGSACSSQVPAPSHVLVAMGCSGQEAEESLRFSLGRDSTELQVRAAAEEVVAAVTRLREMEAA